MSHCAHVILEHCRLLLGSGVLSQPMTDLEHVTSRLCTAHGLASHCKSNIAIELLHQWNVIYELKKKYINQKWIQHTLVHCPTVQLAVPGQGSLWWHGSISTGFSCPSHDLSSKAICSSLPRLRTHMTVLLWTPSLPHVTEQCCQGPVHHLQTQKKYGQGTRNPRKMSLWRYNWLNLHYWKSIPNFFLFLWRPSIFIVKACKNWSSAW